MSVSRPLPKSLLKMMFLKVLHEHHRPGGVYNGYGHDYHGIVRNKLSEFFVIEPLSDEEQAQGLRAVFELERDGFIMQDQSQSSDAFKVLTDRGKEVVDQDLEDFKLPAIDIDQLLTRDDLRKLVRDNYLEADYETAIFKAFKCLEELVRSKAGLPPSDIGVVLMSKAFNPSSGILSHPDAQVTSEHEGFHALLRGSIKWFKNPSSHRTVGYHDPEEAAHVLAFANLLLDLVDQC